MSYGSRKRPAHFRFFFLARIRRVKRPELGATAAPSRASGICDPVDQNAIRVIGSEHTMVNGLQMKAVSRPSVTRKLSSFMVGR